MLQDNITRNESSAIKGILIFLIVLGHNPFFTNFFVGSYNYIYSFHIACFFILSMTYPTKPLSKVRLLNYTVRFYYPYWVMFLFYASLSFILSRYGIEMQGKSIHNNSSLYGFFATMINGGIYSIPKYTLFQYLWFLPAMFSFCIIKDYFSYCRFKVLRWLLVILAFVCFIIFYVFMYFAPYPIEYNIILESYSICSVGMALGFFFIGYIAIICLRRGMSFYTYLLCFIILTSMYWLINTELIKWICRAFMPIASFGIFYKSRKILSNIRLLRKVGQISMAIYLIQSPIVMLCYIGIPYIINIDSWGMVILTQVFIFLLCYFIALGITRCTIAKRFFIPRTLNELLGKN